MLQAPDMPGFRDMGGMDLQQMMLAGFDPAKLAGGNAALRQLYAGSSLGQASNGSPSPASSAPSTAPADQQADLAAQLQMGMPGNLSALLEQMQAVQSMQGLLGGGMSLPGLPSLPPNQQQFTSPSKDAYCDLCDKFFCNRSFLRTHRQNKHGIMEDGSPAKNMPASPGAMLFGGKQFPFGIPASTSQQQQSVIVSAPEEEPSSPNEKRARVDEDNNDDKKASSLDSLLLASIGGTSSACDECGKQFGSVFAVIAHKARDHGEGGEMKSKEASPAGEPKLQCAECDKEFESAQFLEQHMTAAHGGGMARQLLQGLLPPGFPSLPFMLPQGMNLPPFPMSMDELSAMTPPKPQAPKRQYSSNGKNYCDLCNKEVCNKYFLRTHMLKMHGIVIDENKTVIANIDTLEKEKLGTLSFRCDICMVELKSRQLLRSHKQEQHGVVPLQTPQRQPQPPQSSTPQQHKMSTPLQNPMMGMMGLSTPIEQQQQPQQVLQTPKMEQEGEFRCRFCPASFSGEIEQQMHAISQHTMEIIAQASQATGEPEKPSDVLTCAECQYTTTSPRNLEIHNERHERMNQIKAAAAAVTAVSSSPPVVEDMDMALKLTTDAALHMVEANKTHESTGVRCGQCERTYTDEKALETHRQIVHSHQLSVKISPRKRTSPVKSHKLPFPCPKCRCRFASKEESHAHLASCHLRKEEEGDKQRTTVLVEEEHEERALPNERNSHTSGSLSPSSSLPEGFARATESKPFQMQSLLIRDASGVLPAEMLAHLPVRLPLLAPLRLTLELLPAPEQPRSF